MGLSKACASCSTVTLSGRGDPGMRYASIIVLRSPDKQVRPVPVSTLAHLSDTAGLCLPTQTNTGLIRVPWADEIGTADR